MKNTTLRKTYKSNAYENRRLRLLAREVRGSNALDLGYAQLPNRYLSNVRRVGVDLSESKNHDVIYEEELIGDVTQLEDVVGKRQFDTIIAGEIIEHLENPYQFLRNLSRNLSSNGRVLLSTPNPLGFPVFACEILRVHRFFYTRDHTYYFLPRWVERMADFCGYEVKRIIPVGLWMLGVAVPICPVWLSYQVIYVLMPRRHE